MFIIAAASQEVNDCGITTNPTWTIAGAYTNSLSVTGPIISNKLTSARTTFSLSWSV